MNVFNERYRGQSRELALISRVRSAVTNELEVSGVLSSMLEAVAETYDRARLCAYLLEGEELVLQHQNGHHELNGRIPATLGLFGRALRAGDPVLVEDVGDDPDAVGSTDSVTSEICVPLLDEGETVGFLDVQSVGAVKLTQDDLRVMVGVCEQVGVALGRARLYATVRHSEGRYRALTQNSSDLVTLIEATGIVRYQSPAIEWILGYSQEELIGKNAFDYVHPDHLKRVETAFAEVVNDPERQPSAEYRFRHKDGSWRWLESIGTNLTEQPGVGGFVINTRDVTRRKEAEERLREAEERYRMVVERIPAITYIQQIRGNSESVYVSPQVTDILGYTPEEWTSTRTFGARSSTPTTGRRSLPRICVPTRLGSPSSWSIVSSPRRGTWCG